MKILVINSGSSSVKFTLFQMDSDTVLAYGLVERIGLTDTHLSYKNSNGAGLNKNIDVADTGSAVTKVTALLQDRDIGVIQSLSEVAAVGHRVVHGGEKIKTSALITKEV